MIPDFYQWSWNNVVEEDCRRIVRLAALEDLGSGYDWTTVALVPESGRGAADIVAREPGRAAGLAAIPAILDELDLSVTWTPYLADGDRFDAGDCLGRLAGPARELLTCERLILNLLGHLTGIASLTDQYVRQISTTSARIYDTRKTCPGYRHLEKYAVRCGGGWNHRTGLHDAILIKDNHLAFGAGEQAGSFSPAQAVRVARQFLAETFAAPASPTAATPRIVEVEVDSLAQFAEVLPAGPDIILLDNMPLADLATAVQQRNHQQSHCLLEASGGINLQTVAGVAATGVDRISVGSLTHSARCLDLGLDWSVT